MLPEEKVRVGDYLILLMKHFCLQQMRRSSGAGKGNVTTKRMGRSSPTFFSFEKGTTFATSSQSFYDFFLSTTAFSYPSVLYIRTQSQAAYLLTGKQASLFRLHLSKMARSIDRGIRGPCATMSYNVR